MDKEETVLIEQGNRDVSLEPTLMPGQDDPSPAQETTTEEAPAVPEKDTSPVFDPKAFEAITGKKLTDDLIKEEKKAEEREKKVDEEAKEPEVKEQVEEKKEEPEVKLPPTARPPATTGSKGDDFDPIESQLFKRMANDAREYFQDKLRVLKRTQKEFEETKKAKAEVEDRFSKSGQLPASWYESENAFVLDPNYQQVQQAAGMAKWALDHYMVQLQRIKEGQEWEDLVQNPTTGEISTAKRQPDTASEVLITQRINNANLHYQQQNQAMINLKATFSGRVKEAFTNVRKVEDNYFPQYADEKAAAENPHIKTMMDVLKTRSLDRNILAGFLSKLYAFSMEQAEELAKVKAENEKANKLKQITAKTEPPASKITGTAGTKSGNTVDEIMAQFEKVKAGL